MFQCPIVLPFHTVHGVLKARIQKWFAIPFSSGPCFVRTLHHDPSVLSGPLRCGCIWCEWNLYAVDEFVSSWSYWYWNLSSLKIKITFMKKQGHREILNWTNVEYSKKYENKAWLCFSFSFFKRCLWFKLGLPRWLSHKRIHLPMQEPRVRYLGWEDSLKEEMATHSSILAWEIPWTEKPAELQSTGSQRVRCN